MRRFVDLRLCPSISDYDQLKSMIKKSSELGYRLVGIPLPPNISREETDRLQRICNDAKTELVTRVEFFPRTPSELLRDLRRFRRRFEIVAVWCTSKRIARQAARDRRVDLLSFPAADPYKRFFDDAEAQLASKALSCLEIEMAPLLSLKGFARIRLLSRLRNEWEIAKKFKVPVTISSGATSDLFLRDPHDYAALATLFNMSFPSALQALSETPISIVKRNKEKLSPGYISPGIRVVRRKRGA